ncbi:MAG: SRPBCC family protein [Kutzneria sp.]|nr:SRPBCC family protein [Kutzneria sp.]
MIESEHSTALDHPAATVFAFLTDLEARSTWITGIQDIRVTPHGPARPGTSYFESGKFSGFKSEKTMRVTQYEQDRQLTLETAGDAKPFYRMSYRVEPVSSGACRVHSRVEIGGAPKAAELFMRKGVNKSLQEDLERLGSVLASWAASAS